MSSVSDWCFWCSSSAIIFLISTRPQSIRCLSVSKQQLTQSRQWRCQQSRVHQWYVICYWNVTCTSLIILPIALLGHIAAVVLDVAYCYRCIVVCVSVGHNHEPYKSHCTDQGAVWHTIRIWTRVGPRNELLSAVPISSGEGAFGGGAFYTPLWSTGIRNIWREPKLFCRLQQWCGLLLSVLQQLVIVKFIYSDFLHMAVSKVFKF